MERFEELWNIWIVGHHISKKSSSIGPERMYHLDKVTSRCSIDRRMFDSIAVQELGGIVCHCLCSCSILIMFICRHLMQDEKFLKKVSLPEIIYFGRSCSTTENEIEPVKSSIFSDTFWTKHRMHQECWDIFWKVFLKYFFRMDFY